MNEPIISPFLVYWIFVLNNIRMVLISVTAICLLTAGILALEYDCERENNFLQRAKCYFTAGCIAGILLVFIPSREVAISMLVAQNLTKSNIAATVESIEELTERITAAIVRGMERKENK